MTNNPMIVWKQVDGTSVIFSTEDYIEKGTLESLVAVIQLVYGISIEEATSALLGVKNDG